MKFSERWLRSFVDPPLSSEALAESLTMSGIEVEERSIAAPAFSGVVVGEVVRVSPHPGADRLHVCEVDAGGAMALEIVCGAPNAARGMKAPCALVGAKLPGGTTIEQTVVRGVESNGMLCSAKELGISDDDAGLLVLDQSAKIGENLRCALALDDTLMTLKLTPNRGDCLSILGIAREVSAQTGAPLKNLPPATVRVASDRRRPVQIEAPEACPRFCGRIVAGIDAHAATPQWMKERLHRSGVRSISAVVDITNYVMLEVGQPLHAYDDDLLEGDLIVRFARNGETMKLLNEQVVTLSPDLLLVCDQQKPLGLAGIMGGENSGITDATKNVYLEGAFWHPLVIQGKVRRLGFTSDAAYRFERGVDYANTANAVERATELMLDICGGSAGPLTDRQGDLPQRTPVRVRPARVIRLLGLDVTSEAMEKIFSALKFGITREGDDFMVTAPTCRFDLEIEEDFIEEIARLYGYDNIPAAPAAHVQRILPAPEALRTTMSLKRLLSNRDYHEVITFSFVSADMEKRLGVEANPIAVLNPIASHLNVMRSTLLGGALEVLQTNLSRRQDRIRVFEVGRCFVNTADGLKQPLRIGGLAYGSAAPEQWGEPSRSVDFYDVKSDIEALAAPAIVTTVAAAHPALHPGRSARVVVGGKAIGWIGELHPRLVQGYGFLRPPIAFEMDVPALLATPLPAASQISPLPIARRDIALLVDEQIPTGDILAAIHAQKPPTVVAAGLFDVYRGAGIEVGKKSIAILMLIQDTERTLTDAEIDATVDELVTALHEQFGATLRH